MTQLTHNTAKKNFVFPESLIERADRVSKNKEINLSELTRIALEEYLKKAEQKDIEKLLADAGKLYYEEDKKIAEEWRTVEGEV